MTTTIREQLEALVNAEREEAVAASIESRRCELCASWKSDNYSEFGDCPHHGVMAARCSCVDHFEKRGEA